MKGRGSVSRIAVALVLLLTLLLTGSVGVAETLLVVSDLHLTGDSAVHQACRLICLTIAS